MSTDYLAELPPEIISLLPPLLSTPCLNALTQTCWRLHEILQPVLESRITSELAQELLQWAAASKPHIVSKLLSPPHSITPGAGYRPYWSETPLHIAARAGNIETTALLLNAGADPTACWGQDEYQPLHLAAINNDAEMMKLLLDHGAPIDENFRCDGCSGNALHYACSMGYLQMVVFLLSRGAHLESGGHYGTALGFAVHSRKLDVVKLLLRKGANAAVTVPLFVLLDGGQTCPSP